MSHGFYLRLVIAIILYRPWGMNTTAPIHQTPVALRCKGPVLVREDLDRSAILEFCAAEDYCPRDFLYSPPRVGSYHTPFYGMSLRIVWVLEFFEGDFKYAPLFWRSCIQVVERVYKESELGAHTRGPQRQDFGDCEYACVLNEPTTNDP